MKKIIFILLGCVNVNLNFGQCGCCGSSSNISAGEITPTAYSLNKKQFLAELYSDFRTFDSPGNISTNDHQVNSALNIKTMDVAGVGLRYGINSKTALMIQQPYVFINASTTSSKAFGDLLSLVNFRVLSKPNFIIGLQAGMEWPTGQYILSGSGNSISTGSGSFDPVGGVNVIKAFKRSNVRANAFFKYTTKGFNQTNFGDFFSHQIGYSYFILNPASLCVADSITPKKTSTKTTLALNFQMSGEWSQAQMKDHVMIANTGSYVALAGIGAVIGFSGFTIPVLVSVPVYHEFYGMQNQNTLRLRIGLTKTFN